MLLIRINTKLERRLYDLSRKTGHPVEFFVKRGMELFLNEEEDYLIGVARLQNNNKQVSFDDVKVIVDV